MREGHFASVLLNIWIKERQALLLLARLLSFKCTSINVFFLLLKQKVIQSCLKDLEVKHAVTVFLYALICVFPQLSQYRPAPFLEDLPLVTAGFLFTGGAWKAECSLHRRSWKLMNFHIMKACVMQIEARTAILKSMQKISKN